MTSAAGAAAAILIAAGCAPPAAPPATVEIAAPASAPVVVAATMPQPPRPAAPAAGSIAWRTNEREAREEARRREAPLLVWARADWAAAALSMERSVWTDPRVIRAAAGFVALRLDLTEAEGDAELFAQRYGVDVMPATIVMDAGGRKIAVIRGFADAEALAGALVKAAP